MANNEFIKILLDAGLKKNVHVPINRQIKEIEKKVEAINLEIKIDDRTVKNINKAVAQIQKLDDEAIRVTKNQQKYISGVQSKIETVRGETKKLEQATKDLGETQAEASKKSVKAIDLENEKLKDKIDLWKAQKQVQIDRMRNQYGDSSELRELENRMNGISVSTEKASQKMQMFNVDVSRTRMDLSNANRELGFVSQALTGFGSQIMGFLAINVSIGAMFRELRNGVGVINELDGALTEIAMVTNQSRDDVKGLAREYNVLAKEMKVSTSDISKGAVTFYRQGLKQEEVMDRLTYATMYSKVANMDFNDATEILTATMNSMGLEAEKVVDVLLYLGDATATSGEEVGKGFARTSGSARAMDMEFEKVASWIATISANTREGAETIGRSINTILSRMSNLKEKGYNEEDETQVNDVAKALQTVGIELMNNNGEWNDFGDVIDELGTRWKDLDDKTQSYIATTMAGTQQKNRFLNLMESYQDSMELYEGAVESQGTASSKFDTYLDSNQAKIDELKATIEGFWITTLDSDMLTRFIDMLINLIEKLELLVDKYGGVIANTVKWGVELGVTYLAVSKLAKGIEAIMGLIGLVSGGKALASLTAINPVVAGITAGILGIAKTIGYLGDKREEEANHISNLVDLNNEYTQSLAESTDVLNEIMTLNNAEDLSEEEYERLLELQRELAIAYPEWSDNIDAQGQLIVTNTENIRELLNAQRELAGENLSETMSGIEEAIPQSKEKIKELTSSIEDLQERLASGDTDIVTKSYDNNGRAIQQVSDGAEHLRNQLEKLTTERQNEQIELAQLESQYDLTSAQMEDFTESVKWAKAEELALTDTTSITNRELKEMKVELIDLGFTAEDVTQIIAGNFDKVKEKYQMLSEEQLVHWENIETIDEVSRNSAVNRIRIERELTQGMLEQAQTRVKAIQMQIDALSQLGSIASTTVKLPKGFKPTKAQGKVIDQIKKDYNLTPAVDKMINSEVDEIKGKIKRLDNIEERLLGLSAPSSSINSGGGGKGGKSGKGNKGGKGSKDKNSSKSEQLAEADRYENINIELQKQNNLLDRNRTMQTLISNLGKDSKDLDHYKNRILLMEEEAKLNKNKQIVISELAKAQRQERNELERKLSGQGFNFAGAGDDRMINNLEHISGKSKEVETDFKRYIDLQTKELPKLSTEWWGLQSAIDSINMEKIKIEAEKLNVSLEIMAGTISTLDKEMSLLDDKDYNGKAQKTAEQVDIIEKQMSELEDTMNSMINHSFKEGTAEYVAHNEEMGKMIGQYKDYEIQLKKTKEAVDELRNSHMKEWIAEQNKLYDEQQDHLSELDKLQEKIADIIRKRGEKEKRDLEKSHKEALEKIKKEHDSKITSLKEEKKAQDDLIQAKLDALKEQHEEEDYAEKLKEEEDKLAKIQLEVDRLALDTSLEGRTNLNDAIKRLEEQKTAIEKMEKDKARKDEIKFLEDKKKGRDEDLKSEEEKSKKDYEDEKKTLEKKYEKNKEYLEEKYSNENIYIEAKKSLLSGYVEYADGEMLSLEIAIDKFEKEFGKKMGIMGDYIEHQFVDQWGKAQTALHDFDEALFEFYKKWDFEKDKDFITDSQMGYTGVDTSKNGNRPKQFQSWEDDDYNEYVRNKENWSKTKSASERKAIERRNAILREKYEGNDGILNDNHSLDDLQNWNSKSKRPAEFQSWSDSDYRRYVDNKEAWLTETNPSRKQQIEKENEEIRRRYKMKQDRYSYEQLVAGYKTGGFIPRDGLVMAHEKELVIPLEYQKNLWEFVQKIGKNQSLGFEQIKSTSIGTSSGLTYDIDVFVDGQKLQNPELVKLIRNEIEVKERNKERYLKGKGVR